MPNNNNNPRLIAGASAGGLAAAIALIVPLVQHWEGHASRPYKDVGGVLTVCYGHTGRDIVVKTYSNPECITLLDQDISTAAQGVIKISPNLRDRPNILAAAISFSYNVGLKTYAHSSVYRDFSAGQYRKGCTDLLKYTYAGGQYSNGLANRRKAEYTICMKGVT